jgi:hypothetical protein
VSYVGLGALAGSDPFTKYGSETARGLVAIFRRLPVSDRAAAMKAAMAKIDPTLQARAEKHAKAARAAGAPAAQALEAGIAKAITEGVTTELATLGRTGRRPAPESLLGLGSIAGALTSFAKVTPAASPPASVKSIQVGPFSMPAGNTSVFGVDIRSPSQLPSSWKAAIAHALRRGAGESGPLRPWKMYQTNYTNAHPLPGTGGVPSRPRVREDWIWRNEGEIWKADFCHYLEALGIKCGKIAVGTEQINPNGGPFGGVVTQAPDSFASEMLSPDPRQVALTWEQMRGEGDERLIAPVAKFKHPITGDDWGVFLSLRHAFSGRNMRPDDNYPIMTIYFARIPGKPWYHKVWGVISYIPAKIGAAIDATAEAIIDAGKWVGDKTCDLVNKVAPIAATGAVAPDPKAKAVAGGAIVAAGICGGLTPPLPPPFYPPPASSALLPLLLVGGGVLVVALTTRSD